VISQKNMVKHQEVLLKCFNELIDTKSEVNSTCQIEADNHYKLHLSAQGLDLSVIQLRL
jgi:hypothetical protein